MSTSLLYHGFGLPGYRYVHQNFERGEIIFRVCPKGELYQCPVCKSTHIVRRGTCIRKLRSVPIGLKPVWIEVEIPRVYCTKCNCVRQINIRFARPRKSYTRAFERYVIELSRVMTIQDIAKLLRVSWDCVKDIVKNRLLRRFSRPSLRNVKYIGIDEISVKKGHKYLTVVMDIEKGNVIYVGNGKGGDALIPFWKRIKQSKCQLLGVSTDLGQAYISAVIDNLPGVPLIFDHFHVVKLMNDTLTEIRRNLYHELKCHMEKSVLKGTRWILIKNPDNLSKKYNEKEKLDEALKLNEPLAKAYYMKEELRQFWMQPSREDAEKLIEDWTQKAWSSGIGKLQKMGNTIAAHRYGILNWYDHKISSGRVEGTNNKIKVLKRMSYGYRDMEFFKLRIMAIHESKYALVG